LIQVIVNLLSNAVKFCHQPNGLVVVSAELRDEGLYVSVADNGPGVATDKRGLIFEKFQQAGEVLTQRPPGTGLGLPICRQIVEYFGGRIWVQSDPGQGTRFAFIIPYAHHVEKAPAPVAE
jgi:signal transduction histidine kinase